MLANHRVVVRRHLIQTRPPFDEAHVLQRRQAPYEVRIEVGHPPGCIAREVLSVRLVQLCFCQHDPVGEARDDRILVAPMDAARVDDHREAIRPDARQVATKEVLAHRRHGLINARELSDHRRERTGGVHDDRRVDAAG